MSEYDESLHNPNAGRDDRISHLLGLVLENIYMIEHGCYSLSSCEDFDVGSVVNELKKLTGKDNENS